MPPKQSGPQHGPSPYQFVTDPSYDETLSGRVRAACINCSRRKVKCSGRIPCETCISQGKICEGLKKPRKWERRRKRGPIGIPLNVRAPGSEQNWTDDNSSQTKSSQRIQMGHSRRTNQPRTLSSTGETLQAQSALQGYSGNFPPFMLPLAFEQPEYGASSSFNRPTTSRSLTDSPYCQSAYSDPAIAPSAISQQVADWQIDPVMSTQSTPGLPMQGQRSSPFILAAESLEHQARMLRLMDRRHSSVDGGYLDNMRPSSHAGTIDPVYGVSPSNVIMNDEITATFPAMNQVAIAPGNMSALNPRNLQQWPQNWQQDGAF